MAKIYLSRTPTANHEGVEVQVEKPEGFIGIHPANKTTYEIWAYTLLIIGFFMIFGIIWGKGGELGFFIVSFISLFSLLSGVLILWLYRVYTKKMHRLLGMIERVEDGKIILREPHKVTYGRLFIRRVAYYRKNSSKPEFLFIKKFYKIKSDNNKIINFVDNIPPDIGYVSSGLAFSLVLLAAVIEDCCQWYYIVWVSPRRTYCPESVGLRTCDRGKNCVDTYIVCDKSGSVRVGMKAENIDEAFQSATAYMIVKAGSLEAEHKILTLTREMVEQGIGYEVKIGELLEERGPGFFLVHRHGMKSFTNKLLSHYKIGYLDIFGFVPEFRYKLAVKVNLRLRPDRKVERPLRVFPVRASR